MSFNVLQNYVNTPPPFGQCWEQPHETADNVNTDPRGKGGNVCVHVSFANRCLVQSHEPSYLELSQSDHNHAIRKRDPDGAERGIRGGVNRGAGQPRALPQPRPWANTGLSNHRHYKS